jgi:hypothetical protein
MVTTASTAVVRLIVLIVRVVKATIHYCSRYAPRCIKCTFFHTDSRNIRHSLGGTHSTIFSAQLADTFDMPPLPEPDYFQRAIERSPNISSIQSIPSPTVIKCYNVKFPGLKSLPDDNYRRVGASSSTTAKAIPPKIVLCKSAVRLEKLADGALADKRACRTSSSPPSDATSRLIASNFKMWSNQSEQDICSVSSAYVMTEISEVLQILYPNGWEISTECTEARL